MDEKPVEVNRPIAGATSIRNEHNLKTYIVRSDNHAHLKEMQSKLSMLL
jgi:hypothetical protein